MGARTGVIEVDCTPSLWITSEWNIRKGHNYTLVTLVALRLLHCMPCKEMRGH